MALSNYLPNSRINQSGVCTSTTRPTSPYEGQLIYETDTDMMFVWDGSSWKQFAGTNSFAQQGLYKITPTSVSGTGASIDANGNVVVVSGGNSFTVNGVFSSLYRTYRITINSYLSSFDAGLIASMGTSLSTTSGHVVNGATFGSTVNPYSATGNNWDMGMVANASSSAGGAIDLYSPWNSEETSFVCNSVDSRNFQGRWRGGGLQNNTSYTAMTFGTNTGANFTSILLGFYGYYQ